LAKRVIAALGLALPAFIAVSIGTGGASAASRQGAVAGWVGPCIGTATKVQYAKIPEIVSLIHGSELMKHEKLHGKTRYRFQAPAGTYTLEVNVNGLPTGSLIPGEQVTLMAGRVVHLNLVQSCK
jgi:hypothetical protein